MQGNTLVKLIIVAAVLFVLWTKGLPWLKKQGGIGGTSSSSSSPSSKTFDTCLPYAESASSNWGSGVMRFTNPPYDLAAWGDFRSNVESKIRKAEEKCSCNGQSCVKAREAMTELRTVLGEADASIRDNAPPPSDLVQRQERIDNALDAARDAIREGK